MRLSDHCCVDFLVWWSLEYWAICELPKGVCVIELCTPDICLWSRGWRWEGCCVGSWVELGTVQTGSRCVRKRSCQGVVKRTVAQLCPLGCPAPRGGQRRPIWAAAGRGFSVLISRLSFGDLWQTFTRRGRALTSLGLLNALGLAFLELGNGLAECPPCGRQHQGLQLSVGFIGCNLSTFWILTRVHLYKSGY